MLENSDYFAGKSDPLPQTSQDLGGSILFTDLFTPEFMRKYTQFESIDELLASGGFEVNSEEDYEAIPDAEIDAHVAKTTRFHSWKELLTDAIETYSTSH